jgi:hypothetical protein
MNAGELLITLYIIVCVFISFIICIRQMHIQLPKKEELTIGEILIGVIFLPTLIMAYILLGIVKLLCWIILPINKLLLIKPFKQKRDL